MSFTDNGRNMLHMHLFRHQHARKGEQYALLQLPSVHLPSHTQFSAIQVNSLNSQSRDRGNYSSHELQCLVARDSGDGIEMSLASGQNKTEQTPPSRLLLAPSSVVSFPGPQPYAEQIIENRQSSQEFLKSAEQHYLSTVPPEMRRSELSAFNEAQGSLMQIEGETVDLSGSNTTIANQAVAMPQVAISSATSSSGQLKATLTTEAMRDANSVLKGLHLYERVHHYVQGHCDEQQKTKATAIHKAKHTQARALLLQNTMGHLFSHTDTSTFEIPASTLCAHRQTKPGALKNKNGPLSVCIRPLSSKVSLSMLKQSSKTGKGRYGLTAHVKLEAKEPTSPMQTNINNELQMNMASGSHCAEVFCNTTSKAMSFNRFSMASMYNSFPEAKQVQELSHVEGTEKNKPYMCILNKNGQLWLQTEETNKEGSTTHQLHSFDASIYNLPHMPHNSTNPKQSQLSAADLLLGRRDENAVRPKNFKEGSQVLASYPKTTCILSRYGPCVSEMQKTKTSAKDDIVFLHVNNNSMCDDTFMASMHTGSGLHKQNSVTHAIASYLNVPTNEIALSTAKDSIVPVPAGRRMCTLTSPLTEANMSTWSSAPYVLQAKKLQTFAIGFKDGDGAARTALVQVNTCANDRQGEHPASQHHGGVQVLTVTKPRTIK